MNHISHRNAILVLLVSGCLMLAAWKGRSIVSTQDQSSTAPASVFKLILPQIKSKTQVPILLPSKLPQPIDGAKFALVKRADAKGYDISLYYHELPGAEASYAASFGGKKGELPPWVKKHVEVKVVKLINGIIGYFRPRSCGGTCDSVYLWWEQNANSYSVDLRLSYIDEAEQEKIITAVGNSAIIGGSR